MTQIQRDELTFKLTHESGTMTPLQAWFQVRLIETQLELGQWAHETQERNIRNGKHPLGTLIY